MKILQFAFESDDESTFLPHQFDTKNCICYTGTHDNNTTQGWYKEVKEKYKDRIRRYMNTDGNLIHWDFVRTCLGTIADKAIFPLQDVLGIDEEGRMNTPGVAAKNWAWRYEKEDLNSRLAKDLKRITKVYGR